MAKSKSERTLIQIENPAPGGHTQTSLAHARRYCRKGIAELVAGRLRFLRHESSMATLRHSPTPMPVAPRIQDARPDMPVLPPGPEWMQRMGYEVFA